MQRTGPFAISEIAARTGFTKQTIRARIADGELPSAQVGGRTHIVTRSDLAQWLGAERVGDLFDPPAGIDPVSLDTLDRLHAVGTERAHVLHDLLSAWIGADPEARSVRPTEPSGSPVAGIDAQADGAAFVVTPESGRWEIRPTSGTDRADGNQ